MSEAQTDAMKNNQLHIPKSVSSRDIFKSETALTGKLWVDGIILAYEFIPALRKKVKVGDNFNQKSGSVRGNFNADISIQEPNISATETVDGAWKRTKSVVTDLAEKPTVEEEVRSEEEKCTERDRSTKMDRDTKREYDQWVPIGWDRIGELCELAQCNIISGKADEMMLGESNSEASELLTVADQAAPYWQSPVGPTWWCHVDPRHSKIQSWLKQGKWLHHAVSTALIDESRLISDRMNHLYYEVPVRVAGGILLELLGHSFGKPDHGEDDVAVVLRSWASQNFLVTAMHVKGDVASLNVIGISEVQDLVKVGGSRAPKTSHEVIALLADRLARWDDRMFRKYYFGAADSVELIFVSRKEKEDLDILRLVLNQEIRKLTTQVNRVNCSLHAREEILFELMAHLRGKSAQAMLVSIKENTRDMLQEQDGVRDRLFTVQAVMQSTVRAALQDKSVRVQHNLTVIGGPGLLLSIIAGLFGINVGGMWGENNEHAFLIFTISFFLFGAILIAVGWTYLGLKKPPTDEQLEARKSEMQKFVKRFQKSIEAHEKVKDVFDSHHENPSGNLLTPDLDDAYLLMTEV